MVKVDVNYSQNKYTHKEYSTWGTVSSLGTEMGWVIPETISSTVDGIREVEKSFKWDTGLKGVCNTTKLTKGLGTVSSGYEFVYALTSSPKELVSKGIQIIHFNTSCVDRIDALSSFLGEISAVCGGIKFFHRIEAVNISHLINGVEITKYSAGLASCILNIGLARHWISTKKPIDASADAKAAHEARITAKKYSYLSNASLGSLYGALLLSKRTKVNNYVFIVAGLASSLSVIALHFKTARADHAEAKFAATRIAPAA